MSRNNQLAGHTERNAAQLLVYNILLHVLQRHTDGNAVIQLFDAAAVRENGAFGRSVGVIKPEAVRRLDGNKPFSADKKIMRIFRVGIQLGELPADLPADLRRHKGVGNGVIAEIISDCDQVKADRLVDDMQLSAAEKHRIHIHHMGVKAVACVRRGAAGFVHLIVGDIPVAEGAEVAVLEHHALGYAGGAGGVEHDKEVAGLGIFGNARRVGQCGNLIGIQNGTVVVRHRLRQRPVGDQVLRVRVLHHKFQPLARITRIQRLIAGSCFQYTDRGDRHILAARYQHGNHLIFADALAFQEGGDVFRQAVYLTVGKAAVEIHHCGMIGFFSD